MSDVSQEMLAERIKGYRTHVSAQMADPNGFIYDKEVRVSVLRDAKDVISAMTNKSLSDRLIEKILVNANTKSKKVKELPTIADIGNRFMNIAVAASIVLGVMFVSEQTIGVIDSAHASTALGKHIQ